MQTIRDCVNAVRVRQQRQWIWNCLSWGLVIGGVVGCVLALSAWLMSTPLPWSWLAVSLLACPGLGLLFAVTRPRPNREAAVSIDRNCGLKDRTATAIEIMSGKDITPIRELQIEDTARCVSSIDPFEVAPIAAPKPWIAGIALTFIAVLLAVVVGGPDEVSANVVTNEVVSAQALRVTDSLRELEEFNNEELDPEIEKLLKELAKHLEEMKEPQTDPKEALAKLSEMEAALHEQQEKLNIESAEASLQQVGDALSLAEPLASAGEAMSQGEMEKAAEELAKLDLPELDRKTEKAITEKLDRVDSDSNGAPKKNLKTAIQQLSQGLSQGNRSKFKDGLNGLAGECKKQGRRKRLSDLLRKQCQCLGECKSECEGACKSNKSGKGGNNWGLAASGNEPGEKTSKLKTSPQMEIKGQESNQGDVEVETISSEEQSQQAVREYRKQADKYEQLSESVLSSEPIPLGHRQTIRRYFEMIRPQGEETDAVLEQTAE